MFSHPSYCFYSCEVSSFDPPQQIIRAAMKNPLDLTHISLIYANVNFDDILLKKELDGLAAAHPERFSVYYVLNNPPAEWNGGVGFVSEEMVKERLPTPSNVPGSMKILLCGMSFRTSQCRDSLINVLPRSPSDDDRHEKASRRSGLREA